MLFEQLIQRVENRLADLFDADAREQRAEAIAQVRGDIAELVAELDTATRLRGEVTVRLQKQAEEAALLPSRIESSVLRGKTGQAMRQALELEALRRQIATDHAEVPRLEQTIWSLEFRLRQLRRQHAELHKSAGRR